VRAISTAVWPRQWTTGVNVVGPEPSALTSSRGNGAGKDDACFTGGPAAAAELVVIAAVAVVAELVVIAAVVVVAALSCDRLVAAPLPLLPPQPKSNAAAAAASAARAPALAPRLGSGRARWWASSSPVSSVPSIRVAPLYRVRSARRRSALRRGARA
jgi:hypothetical protein